MENGIYIGRKTDDRIKSVYIPEEIREFARLNKRVQARLDDAAKRERENASQEAARARRAANHRRARNRAIAQIAGMIAAGAVVGVAACLGLPSEWLAALVGAMCLTVVGFKIGRLFSWRR